jgi:hypothetical protein
MPTSGSISGTTEIGTSDPIDLCDGFALFPVLGIVRAGIQSSAQTQTIFSDNTTILTWKLAGSAGTQLFAGVCGPSYAILFDAKDLRWSDSDGTQLVEATLSNDTIEGGFFFGFTVDVNLSLKVEEDVAEHWYTPWKLTWETKTSLTFQLKFDLIDIIFDIIRLALAENGNKNSALQKVQNITPSLLDSYGMFDEKSDQFASGEQTISVEPCFCLPINIVSYIPDLETINAALTDLWGYLRMGPSIGICIPTSVTLDKLTVDGHEYTVDSVTEESAGGLVKATGSSDVSGTPSTLGVVLEHSPGFTLTFGVFAAIAACKLFSISASKSWDLLALLDISVETGPYSNSLSSTIGSDVASHSAVFGEPVEVVLEPQDYDYEPVAHS